MLCKDGKSDEQEGLQILAENNDDTQTENSNAHTENSAAVVEQESGEEDDDVKTKNQFNAVKSNQNAFVCTYLYIVKSIFCVFLFFQDDGNAVVEGEEDDDEDEEDVKSLPNSKRRSTSNRNLCLCTIYMSLNMF